jgi:uncharacterized membrane protein
MLGSHLRQSMARLTVSIGQMPLKAFQALFHARWTKSQISWAIAYAYTIYVALGAVPPFKGLSTFSVTAASSLLVVLYFFHSYANLNLKTASKFLGIAATISFIWEFIGVSTGIPFGQYSYTQNLSPSIGPVPIFIPLIWCALGYFCMEASDYYIMASALMVSLDLSFDPVFSSAPLSLWTWQPGGQYFGVPLSNFFGWFLASLTFFAIFFLATKRRTKSSPYAIAFYYLFGLDNVVGDLASGFLWLALASFIIFTLATIIILLVHEDRWRKLLGISQPSAQSAVPIPSL